VAPLHVAVGDVERHADESLGPAGGVALQRFDPRRTVEAWLERAPERQARLRDFNVPAPVIGVVILAGLTAASVVGCFIYFPEPREVFKEIPVIRAEALSAAQVGDVRQTDHWFAVWDDWTRKLEVGVFLRTRRLTPYQHIKARLVREKLELLRHEVEDGDKVAARKLVKQVNEAHRRLYETFVPQIPGDFVPH